MTTFNIDLSDLTGNLNIEAELTEAAVADVRKKLALDLFSDLVLSTPVDTGELRNGWQIETTANEVAIENRVPYALTLMEHGHSKQAPSGTLSNIIDKHTRR